MARCASCKKVRSINYYLLCGPCADGSDIKPITYGTRALEKKYRPRDKVIVKCAIEDCKFLMQRHGGRRLCPAHAYERREKLIKESTVAK